MHHLDYLNAWAYNNWFYLVGWFITVTGSVLLWAFLGLYTLEKLTTLFKLGKLFIEFLYKRHLFLEYLEEKKKRKTE
jgi:hypothetical protein